MVYLALRAPWTGGTVSQEVAIYLPAGYDDGDSKRYPVVYQAPASFALWNSAIHVQATLDALISDGEIPPSLFVFAVGGGGPYADSECADTFDGVEKMDHFLGVTVPAYIDAHYRTIATPAARSIMGMSQGGFCSAILILHHPDVFGSSISFSGYYEAGAGAPSAKLPFGGIVSVINNYSPIIVAPKLDDAAKSNLYMVIVAQRSQPFYGPEATQFVEVLDGAGIANAYVDASEPHGWPQVRDYFARALVLVARREAAMGVFDQPAASPSP
jgi:S-formylglutathione hydrolase FrmB